MASDPKKATAPPTTSPSAQPPPAESFGQQLMGGGGGKPVPPELSVGASYSGTMPGVSFGSLSKSNGSQSSDTGVVGGENVMTAPIQPTIPDAMSDPNYQTQATALARQLADFKAQQELAKNQYQGQYNQTTRRLGYNGQAWDRNIPNGQYGQAVDANEGDFAGRNMIHSGQYANAANNVQQSFNTQLTDVNRARTDFQDTAALSERNMASQQELARQQALASAVSSIAARYGVDLSAVPQSTGG